MTREAEAQTLEPEAGRRLRLYLDALRTWGARTNLVGSLDAAALREHVDDSRAAASHLPLGARVADLGSGAGFPGVPIALLRPDLQLVLVEVRERRVHFLRHVARMLDLPLTVERRRLEDPPEARFDVVLLRAVAAPPRSLELALPWVAEEGEIWIWLGPHVKLPAPVSHEISLGPRGRIAQVQRAAVPCGTA